MISCRNSLLLLAALALFPCGCADFLYNLQHPYRWKKLNSGPGPSLDPEFTNQSRSTSVELVRQLRAVKPAMVTANTAEVSLVPEKMPEN